MITIIETQIVWFDQRCCFDVESPNLRVVLKIIIKLKISYQTLDYVQVTLELFWCQMLCILYYHFWIIEPNNITNRHFESRCFIIPNQYFIHLINSI